jgi:repressor LexA
MLDFSNLTSYIQAYTHTFTITSDQVDDCFAVEAKGDGMINAGISDGDILFFLKTDKFRSGDIVAITVNDESMVRRIFKGRGQVKLCREIGKGEYSYAKDYIVHGRLVGINRKY